MLLKLKKASNHENKKSRSGELQCISIKKFEVNTIFQSRVFRPDMFLEKASLNAVKTV